ncbi:MAG: asparagine synthase (glutamine-hydrolyzing) [Pseudomonadota bacterium]
MCGIAGIINMGGVLGAEGLKGSIEAMTRAIQHRGPDDQGIWLHAESGIGLGHRRLSIVDLSQAGHQPMVSANGRFVIVYNGEVYNHQESRKELEALGVSFRGTSDTEVILEACAQWSLERTLPKLNGMFAFALWDRQEQVLNLVRDRLGIKPLYWAKFGRTFLFGSELKALRAEPSWSPEVRPDSIAAYMRHGYIPAPHTIYEGVHKLEPGMVLTLGLRDGAEPSLQRFWDLRDVARQGQAGRQGTSSVVQVDELDSLLRDAVGRRMIADVPLGAFLSGGIDSSLVAALMQAQSSVPVKTYTIGFGQAQYDEAPHARGVAKHLGTSHTELYVSPDDALAVIPELPHWFDEPFADSSQIPTLIVSRLTRQHVTVALSGDGGDELFTGYQRYFWHQQLQTWFDRMPRQARLGIATALRAVPPHSRDALLRHLPQRLRGTITGSRIQKLTDVLGADDSAALYRSIVSLWQNPNDLVLGSKEARGRLWDPDINAGLAPIFEGPQLVDALTYLPDDILTKVDRASMAVALEARVPLLDYRVVEYAWRLPLEAKVRDGRGKWILREILARYVPNHLIDRPKMGFGVPMAAWLRGRLRDWAEALLDPAVLTSQGLLNAPLVRQMWSEHLAGQNHQTDRLWTVLMLQAWMRTWG